VLKHAIRRGTLPATVPERSSGTATRVHAASTSPHPFQRGAECQPRRVHRRAPQYVHDRVDVRLRTMAEKGQRQVQRLVGHRPPDRRIGRRRAERRQRRARRRGQVKRDEQPQLH
jgi:hypothetical protein